MKKISCNIIRDILPLYLDDVVSDDTRELVEEHLETCDACRMEADILGRNITLPTNRFIKLSDAEVVKKLKGRFLRKKVLVSILSVAAAIAVMIGIYAFMTMKSSFIPYDSTKIRIREEDGQIYASYHGDNLAGSVIVHTMAVIDGEEQDVMIFGYYETLWSKYIESIFKKFQDDSGIVGLGDWPELDRIYYAEFDLGSYLDSCNDSTPPKEWDSEYMIERSEVIWSR